MKRVFISYAPADSDAALFILKQLRERNIDVFFDHERMLSQGRFTRRMANEIRARDCLLLVQSPAALETQQVQAELSFAQENNVEIIPLTVRPLNIRDTSEFAYLLHTRPVDMTGWRSRREGIAAVNQLDRMLRVAADDQRITVANAAQLQAITVLNAHTSWVRSVDFSPDGRFFVSAGNDNTLRLWDARAFDQAHPYPRLVETLEAHNASVWEAKFSSDGLMIASCGNDNRVSLWDIQHYPEVYRFVAFDDHHAPVYSTAFSPDGRLLASASHDNTVHVRDVRDIRQTGTASRMIPLLHTSHVYSVSFSPDSNYVATASRDSAVRLWATDADDLEAIAWRKPLFLNGHTSWVNAVQFSPVGTVLASAANDRTIKLWDIASMKAFATLQGHRDAVNTVAFSPDARLLASTSKDNTVRLWDIATQRELISLRAHDQWINHAIFSPDGHFLITASGDTTIKVWGVQQGDSAKSNKGTGAAV